MYYRQAPKKEIVISLYSRSLPDFILSKVTYLLTPWNRVLLQKLTGSAASREIPLIFGTRKFITVLTSARHLSLSWANSIQSPQLPPTSWRSILIVSSHLRLGLPNGLFPSGLPTRILCTPILWKLSTIIVKNKKFSLPNLNFTLSYKIKILQHVVFRLKRKTLNFNANSFQSTLCHKTALHNEELNDLYCLHNIVRVIK